MIGSLRGRLLDRSLSGEVLIETASGVGYRVSVTPRTVSTLGSLDSEVFVYTHLAVREDAQMLYGFTSREERVAFEALLGAQGVGPAMALAVLSDFNPWELRQVVATADVDALTRVKGVGKKTAARIVLDLQSKLDVPAGDLAAQVAETVVGANASTGPHGDVRAALTQLGYSAEEIRLAVATLPPEGDSGTLLKLALAALS